MEKNQNSLIESRFESLLQDLMGSSSPIPWDEEILSRGFVASIHMFEIVLFMEEQFGVAIDPFDIRPELFQSIHTMARFVREKVEVRADG